jgi:hypothetical protein
MSAPPKNRLNKSVSVLLALLVSVLIALLALLLLLAHS